MRPILMVSALYLKVIAFSLSLLILIKINVRRITKCEGVFKWLDNDNDSS